MDCFISPITIDLGGKYTGLFLAQYYASESPNPNTSVAATLVIPEEGNGVVWSQKQRTATRHRIRSNKRRKLAKRMINHIFFDGLQRPLSHDERQSLHGLLNRRGYNRIESEVDDSILDQVDDDWFVEQLPGYFTYDRSLREQMAKLCQTPDTLRTLQQEALLSNNKNDFKKQLGTEYSKEEKQALADAFETIKTIISNTLNQLDYGHKHRCDYLKDIAREIQHDSRLKKLREELGTDKLLNLGRQHQQLSTAYTALVFQRQEHENRCQPRQ